jgi:tRNA A37 N6-isopentenylltransferase MiaA
MKEKRYDLAKMDYKKSMEAYYEVQKELMELTLMSGREHIPNYGSKKRVLKKYRSQLLEFIETQKKQIMESQFLDMLNKMYAEHGDGKLDQSTDALEVAVVDNN